MLQLSRISTCKQGRKLYFAVVLFDGICELGYGNWNAFELFHHHCKHICGFVGEETAYSFGPFIIIVK